MSTDPSQEPRQEIEPPWITYPSYPPGDFFWREPGEPWFHYVWKPYWDSLSPDDQGAYLERWNVPEEWRRYYFEPDSFMKWLDEIDDE